MRMLEDGRVFPTYGDEVLSWSIDLYNTWEERLAGYPRARAVITSMDTARLQDEYRSWLRSSFDRMFGHNAKPLLAIIEAELAARSGLVPMC